MSPYPVELINPDLTPYRQSNTGIPHIWTFDSGQPGPHVAISAVVHGNEPCGAIALDWLLRREVRPVAGRLSLAFINTRAAEAFDPENPDATRWVDEDFNRLWTPGHLDDPDTPLTAEVERAREIRPWLDSVDLLLDIHSMQHPSPPLQLSGLLPKGRKLAEGIGVPSICVGDQGHAEGMRMRDHGGFADPASPKNAVLVECGQHWAKESENVALECVIRFLRHTGAVPPNFGNESIDNHPEPAPVQHFQVTEAVTIETDDFRFAEDWTGYEHLPKDTLIGHDGAREIRAPHEPTVLIMPSRRLWPGKTAVRLAYPMLASSDG